MSDDVRAVVAKVGMEAWGQEFSGDFGEPALRWDDIDEADQMSHRRIADAILAALAEAGCAVVGRDRFERLQHEASGHQGCRAVRGYLGPSALQPGDLDPLPEPTP